MLIAVHVVSTIVLAVSAWALESTAARDPAEINWAGGILQNIILLQVYLLAFWVCLGQSSWVRRLVGGFLVLGGLEAVYFGVVSGGEDWANDLLSLLIQLLVVAVPLLTLRLTGGRVVVTVPDHAIDASSLRWSLKELLLGITLATLYLGLIRFMSTDHEWSEIISAVFPLVALACVAFAFRAVRLWKLILAVIAIEAVLTAIISWITVSRFVEIMRDEGNTDLVMGDLAQDTRMQLFFVYASGIVAIVVFAFSALLLGSLLVVRSCGYRWVRCEDES